MSKKTESAVVTETPSIARALKEVLSRLTLKALKATPKALPEGVETQLVAIVYGVINRVKTVELELGGAIELHGTFGAVVNGESTRAKRAILPAKLTEELVAIGLPCAFVVEFHAANTTSGVKVGHKVIKAEPFDPLALLAPSGE